MILSAASRLSDRLTVWVARKNNEESFNRITCPMGHSATVWAAQFADVYADDVRPVTFN